MVVRLARETGEVARGKTTVVTGTVLREGKPPVGGRVGAWSRPGKEPNRINVLMQRGRTVPEPGAEAAWSRVARDGTYTLRNLRPGRLFFLFEEAGRAPTVVGPVAVARNDRTKTVDILAVAGGAIEGSVEHVPDALEGMVWVVAFDSTVLWRETRVGADGSFRLEGLPPGRYGLKAGHDAYDDPHALGVKLDDADSRKRAEPWQGAVTVTVTSGATARGVAPDFRPPGPLVDP